MRYGARCESGTCKEHGTTTEHGASKMHLNNAMHLRHRSQRETQQLWYMVNGTIQNYSDLQSNEVQI